MKKIYASIMTVALMLGLMLAIAVPGKAETTYTAIGGKTDLIKKNLVVDKDANIPDVGFSYTITRVDPVAATSENIEILKAASNANIGDAIFESSSQSTLNNGLPTDPADTEHKYAQESIEVTFPNDSFTKPGVYRYVINETNDGKPGVTYDTTPRYLDVFVVADPTTNVLSISKCTLRKNATNISLNGAYVTEPGVKSEGFTNTIAHSNILFRKAVGGNQGDKNKTFTFTLIISNAIPGVYTIESSNVSSNPTSITVASDGTATATYDLSDQSSITVKKLNKSAICTISEDNKDYTATHVVDDGTSVSGNSSGAITLSKDNHSVAFTNTRNGVIPTGVIFTIAPFAIGMLLFGALAFTFMARGNQRKYDL